MNKLRALLLGVAVGAALVLPAATAQADGYNRGPYREPVVVDSWRGFYLGVHGGYGWKNDDFSDILATIGGKNFFVGGVNSSGGLFGAQAGYNWQSGSLVGGLEVDLSFSNLSGSSDSVVLPLGPGATNTITRSDDGKWLGSARGRLGFASGNFLLYGTGGLAWERYEQTNTTV